MIWNNLLFKIVRFCPFSEIRNISQWHTNLSTSMSLIFPYNTCHVYDLYTFSRILSEPSPFDGYGNLKASILEDTVNILEKDTRHCDMPWPLGRAQNGELYKVYRKNWKLEIELAKYKFIVEELKRKSAKERSAAAASEAKRKGSAV